MYPGLFDLHQQRLSGPLPAQQATPEGIRNITAVSSTSDTVTLATASAAAPSASVLSTSPAPSSPPKALASHPQPAPSAYPDHFARSRKADYSLVHAHYLEPGPAPHPSSADLTRGLQTYTHDDFPAVPIGFTTPPNPNPSLPVPPRKDNPLERLPPLRSTTTRRAISQHSLIRDQALSFAQARADQEAKDEVERRAPARAANPPPAFQPNVRGEFSEEELREESLACPPPPDIELARGGTPVNE